MKEEGAQWVEASETTPSLEVSTGTGHHEGLLDHLGLTFNTGAPKRVQEVDL